MASMIQMPLPFLHDPVFLHPHEDTWWFWDETWAVEYGPFDTEAACRNQLAFYLRVLDVPEQDLPAAMEKISRISLNCTKQENGEVLNEDT